MKLFNQGRQSKKSFCKYEVFTLEYYQKSVAEAGKHLFFSWHVKLPQNSKGIHFRNVSDV